MNFPSELSKNAYYAPTLQVDDRSVWCDLLPKGSSPGSSPGTFLANNLCESMAEFFTGDELATDLAGRPKRRKDLPCFLVVVGGYGPEPQQPAWLNLQTQPVTRYTVTSGPAFYQAYQPSTSQLRSRLARAEEEKRDLQTRIALARQVQRVESEVRLLRTEFSALCAEISPVVFYGSMYLGSGTIW